MLYVSVLYRDATRDCNIGEDSPHESCHNNIAKLKEACVDLFGEFVDTLYAKVNGEDKAVGWIFSREVEYIDCDGTFIQESHVFVHTKRPEQVVITEPYYATVDT